MKTYFTASIVGKRHHLQNYKKIIDILKEKKCEVISDHIIKTTENQLSKVTKEERINFQKQLERWIVGSDCMVVETTFPSISVGYEISLAVSRGKPVLMLYSEGEPPSLLTHFKEETVMCEHYTEATLEGIIDDFLAYVKGVNDTRFTFFITSKIAAFLDKVSKQEKIPKSVYLRRLIKREMKDSS